MSSSSFDFASESESLAFQSEPVPSPQSPPAFRTRAADPAFAAVSPINGDTGFESLASAGRGAASAALRVAAAGPCLVRGGAEQWLIYLARFLNSRRMQLVRAIATHAKYVDPAFVAELPAPVEVGQAEALQQAANDCDVLLCWGLGMDDYLADVRPKLCVYIAHGEGEWTRSRLDRSRRSVDHVVAVSERVAEKVCRGFPASVIHNGVDTVRLGQTRSRCSTRSALGFSTDDFVLGFLGRFAAEKCAERLVHAVAQLPPRFKLLMVGWGSQRPSLLNLANDLIPGRYAFVTASSYLGDYYQAMDAFCLVSNQEGFSLALLEAMMCGRPVVVTPVGSVPEVIVDRVNGLVVSGTSASIAEAAQLLQAHPEWAAAVAREGRAFAEEHGHARRMAGEYENLIERLWVQKTASGNGRPTVAAQVPGAVR